MTATAESDYFAGQTILVTGGTGFVGSHFCEALLARGAQVRVPVHQRPLELSQPSLEALKADLTVPADCARVCEGMRFVIHAAGPVSGVGLRKEPYSYLENMRLNMLLLMNTLQAAWHQGVEKFVLFSSSTGYPPLQHAVREEEFWRGEVPAAYLGYGWMRRYFEKLGEFIASCSQMQVLTVRPTAIYGPRDNFDPHTSHVIPALIRRAWARENPFEIWGTGQEVRDFLDVRDLVQGVLLMLEKQTVPEPLNLGYGQDVTIAEIATLILKFCGHTDAEMVFRPDRPVGLPYRRVSIEKARQLLAFSPQISLEEGLRQLCAWYAEFQAQTDRKHVLKADR
jgi:GDP-L-fucose synthase